MPSDLSCHGQQATSGRVTVGGGAMGAMSQRRGSVTWPCRGTRREVGWTGPALWSSNRRASARMSLHVSFAKEKPRACIRRTKLHFWDGMQHASLMPHTEAKERIAIWEAVAVYIQNQLLLHKGVRIPTLGSFDVVPIKAGDEALVMPRPVFRLSRNLVRAHNLTDNTEYLPGHKECELVQYTTVAEAASVSWEEAESCIRGTTSFMSHCLKKGENIALVLKDVGVLLIEGSRVQMKFYYDFLERLCGKENLEEAVFKIPWLMDMIVSPVAAMASLTFSGRVIIFPECVMETMPKPPPRKSIKKSDKESLPPLGQGEKDITENGVLQLQKTMERRKALFSHPPEVPGASSTKKQPGSRKIHAAKPQKFREGRGKKTAPHDGGWSGTDKAVPSYQCGAPILSPEHNYNVFREQPPRVQTSQLLNSRPEKFWSMLQQPQKTILSGYNFNTSCLCPFPYEASSSMQCRPPRAGLPNLGRPRPL
ncbi:coiled-coil domain-containing protein 81-like [Gallus gallus]|uniref:coiled-coil domain-containing protein 81-like n=1 Tax=Gallus gallus TaxID=9031 RepID=UPI001AE4FBFC|nr:coiled-coil domain-containing protein 81-like [Gallus gallus]XP_040541752.1 coiled-coil domain-containing protein 81-like [Gallus gallus]